MSAFLDKSRMLILNASKPLTVVVGRLHAPFSKKNVYYRDFVDLQKVLVPGMVLTTRTRGEMSNLFIPGKYKHGAMYVGDGQVVEAVGKGVVSTHIIDFLLHKDAFAAFFPLFASKEQMDIAAAYALSAIGKPYDYQFKSGNDSFYCFELTYAAYNEAIKNSPWQLRETWGEPTVVGDDFLKATKKWSLAHEVWRMRFGASSLAAKWRST